MLAEAKQHSDYELGFGSETGLGWNPSLAIWLHLELGQVHRVSVDVCVPGTALGSGDSENRQSLLQWN